jgi:hypothetical protein
MKNQPLRKMNFEKLIKDGENPKGFTAQTANGTAHWKGTGWNKDFDWSCSQVEPGPTRPEGRSNRTGE